MLLISQKLEGDAILDSWWWPSMIITTMLRIYAPRCSDRCGWIKKLICAEKPRRNHPWFSVVARVHYHSCDTGKMIILFAEQYDYKTYESAEIRHHRRRVRLCFNVIQCDDNNYERAQLLYFSQSWIPASRTKWWWWRKWYGLHGLMKSFSPLGSLFALRTSIIHNNNNYYYIYSTRVVYPPTQSSSHNEKWECL